MGPDNTNNGDTYTSSYEQPRKIAMATILSIIAVVVLLVGGLMLWYASTHGRVVTDYNGGGGFTLQSVDDEQKVEESIVRKGTTTVRSGSYILRFKDGQSESLKYIEVPTFLRSVKATFESLGERHVERVALATLGNIVQTPAGIMSVDSTLDPGNTFLHQRGDPAGTERAVGNIPITTGVNFMHNNVYTGFTSATDSGNKQLQRYDFGTGKLDTMSKIYDDSGSTGLVVPTTAQNNLFGITYVQKETVSLDVYDGSKLIHEIKGLKDVAYGEDNRRAMSITPKYLAVGRGGNFSVEADQNSSDELNKQPKARDYTITIYDINNPGKAIKSVKIGKTTSVSSIQLNNDGTYLSVVDGSSLRIFSVESGDEVFTYSSTSIIDPQWVSGAQLVFGSVEDGFFRLDAKDRSATALFSPNKTMNISHFDMFDNKLYFTAYSRSEFAATSSSPDGYIMYLDKEAVEGNQLVKNTPNQNNTVSITSLDNTIYAVSSEANYGGDPGFRQIEPSQALKEQVNAFLKLKFTDPGQYKLIYGNHF